MAKGNSGIATGNGNGGTGGFTMRSELSDVVNATGKSKKQIQYTFNFYF